MAKVIIFSRTFPSYHQKKGESTYFVEKFLRAKYGQKPTKNYEDIVVPLNHNLDLTIDFFFSLNWTINHDEKLHTIRAGNRFKAGDYFSPRVWSGKPYNSKQIIIAPDTLITQVYDFEIKPAYKMLPLDYDTDIIINHNFYHSDDKIIDELAKNDGLTKAELLQWFKYPNSFAGQVVCWGDVKY